MSRNELKGLVSPASSFFQARRSKSGRADGEAGAPYWLVSKGARFWRGEPRGLLEVVECRLLDLETQLAVQACVVRACLQGRLEWDLGQGALVELEEGRL